MSALDDLIAQVENEALRFRLKEEASRLVDGKKFGLVFEEHLPELTPLYGAPIRQGATVAVKGGKIADTWRVLLVEGDEAFCESADGERRQEFNVHDLVPVAEFGSSIYPCLTPIDSICRAPDNPLWHLLIEAENYHALQLLQYTCAGQVDCIYIDPPYNTGAKDWKYNNDYVDGNDAWRHSKWLSMMKKRLLLAKKLLKPDSGVLICAIDDNELNTTGLLLKDIFSGYKQFCITIVHNPNGNQGKNFGITNEFLYFMLPTSDQLIGLENREDAPDTRPLRDVSGNSNMRSDAKNCFYPIYIKDERVVGFGDVCDASFHPAGANVARDDGVIEVYPIDASGNERKWVFARQTVESIRGELAVEWNKSRKIWDIIRRKTRFTYKSVWQKKEYNANSYGSKLLAKIFGGKRFDYPKSLYAVEECVRAVCANNPNALILDFFAGSATTLHAVNLLNVEDGGRRRCILVTNNEVSAEEAQRLSAQGAAPGDDAWEAMGIARYVAWPRTVCSIKGQDVTGAPLRGSYLGSDRPMSAGFEANAAFFRLEFLDKASVARREQFRALLPLFWLKAGGIGQCPQVGEGELPAMLIFPQNRFAVLLDEDAFGGFREKANAATEVDAAFLVTDYEDAFRKMADGLEAQTCFQVYRDYLDNFRIVHS